MSSRSIEAGKAFMRLYTDDSALRRGLNSATSKMRAFGGTMRSIGAATAGLGAVMTAPFIASIKAASDAQETLSKFKAVFGEQAGAAEQFADALAKSIGRSAIDIKQGLSAFQAFFVGLGFGPEKARELSQTMQALSLDFASFHNLTDEDAMGRFISAMSGSSEVLDQYGVNIKQAALEQELLRMGITKSWTAVTEQEKALARLSIITRSMGEQGATGDAARTAGSFANQMKRLKAQCTDLAVAIGTAIIPHVTKFVALASAALGPIIQWVSQNGALVATIAGLAVGLTALGIVLGTAGAAFAGIAAAVAALATPVGLAMAAFAAWGVVMLALAAHTGVLQKAISGLKGWIDSMLPGLQTYMRYLQLMGKFKAINKGDFGALLTPSPPSTPPPPPGAAEPTAPESLPAVGGLAGALADDLKRNRGTIGPAPFPPASDFADDKKALGDLSAAAKQALDGAAKIPEFAAKKEALGGRMDLAPRSTSDARLAPQIFGRGQTDNTNRDQLKVQRQMNETLKRIERKKGGMKVGEN